MTERLSVSHSLTALEAALRTAAGRLAFPLQIHTALVGLVHVAAAGGALTLTDAQLGARIGRSTNHVGVMMRTAHEAGWITRTSGDVTAHGRKPCRYRINVDAILDAIKAAMPEAARRRARAVADTAARVATLGPAYLAGHRRKRKPARQSHTTVSDTHDSLRSSSGAQAAAEAVEPATVDYGRPINPGPPELRETMRLAVLEARGRWQGAGRHDAVIPARKRTRLRRGSEG